MKLFLLLILHILSFPVFSRLWGRIVRIQYPRFLIKRIIRNYQRHYQIDMKDYIGETDDYKCLSDFFIRKLDNQKRPLKLKSDYILSPADGVITKIEPIKNDQATQVKGVNYSISELLQENLDFNQGWYVATIYLSPSNYHRFHYPVKGKLKKYCHTKGRLFPVNKVGINFIKKLFIRNERIITKVEKNNFPIYISAVGATFVGSIKMEYIIPESIKKRNRWVTVDSEFQQLDEMGRFEMGSTIVMVIPSKFAHPVEIEKNQSIKMGDPIFKINSNLENS